MDKTRPPKTPVQWYPAASLVFVFIAVLSVIWIWREVRQFEYLRQKEHIEFCNHLVQTSQRFIKKGEYVNFSNVLNLLSKMDFIDYMGMYRENRNILSVGDPAKANKEVLGQLGNTLPAIYIDDKAKQLYTRHTLNYDNVPTDLRILFSLKEYDKAKRGIIIATGVIGVLVLLIAFLGLRLLQVEQRKTNVVKAVGHDGTHYTSLLEVLLDNEAKEQQKDTTLSFLKTLKKKITPPVKLTNRDRSDVVQTIDHYIKLQKSLSPAEGADGRLILKGIVKRLATLLENLQFVENIEKGILDYNPSKVDLVELIAKQAEHMEPFLIKKKMNIVFSHIDLQERVWVDRDKLERVVFNLLHNAYKYAKEHSNIVVSFAKNETQVITYITDEGPGIAKEAWSKVFNPFVRLNDATHVRPEDKRGRGLGLAISKKFIERNQGTMGIEKSEPGMGTTFYFTLPMAKNMKRKDRRHG